MMISWMLIAAVLIACLGFWMGRAAHAPQEPTYDPAGRAKHAPDDSSSAVARRGFPLARWLALAAVACGALFFVRTQNIQVHHAAAVRQEQLAMLEAQAAHAAAQRTQSADWAGAPIMIGAPDLPEAPAPLLRGREGQAVPPATAFASHVQSSRTTAVGLLIFPLAVVVALWLLGPLKAMFALLALFLFLSVFWSISYVERAPSVEQLSQRGGGFPSIDGQFAGRRGHDARFAQRLEADAGVRQAVEESFGHLWQRPEPVIALDTAPVGEPASSDAAPPSPAATASDADAAGDAAAEPAEVAVVAAGAADAAGGADAASETPPNSASPGTSESETPAATAAAERPVWVDQPPRLVGRVDQRVISAGPYLTLEECVPDLQRSAEQAVRDLLRERRQRNDLPFELAGEPPLPSDLGLSLDSILESYCTERYCETLKTSFGQMQQVHALLEFSDAAQLELLHRWRTVLQRERQQRAAAAAGFTVLGVGLAYALLQLDARTHGYYTKRLFLGVPAAIIAGLALLTLIA